MEKIIDFSPNVKSFRIFLRKFILFRSKLEKITKLIIITLFVMVCSTYPPPVLPIAMVFKQRHRTSLEPYPLCVIRRGLCELPLILSRNHCTWLRSTSSAVSAGHDLRWCTSFRWKIRRPISEKRINPSRTTFAGQHFR